VIENTETGSAPRPLSTGAKRSTTLKIRGPNQGASRSRVLREVNNEQGTIWSVRRRIENTARHGNPEGLRDPQVRKSQGLPTTDVDLTL